MAERILLHGIRLGFEVDAGRAVDHRDHADLAVDEIDRDDAATHVIEGGPSLSLVAWRHLIERTGFDDRYDGFHLGLAILRRRRRCAARRVARALSGMAACRADSAARRG